MREGAGGVKGGWKGGAGGSILKRLPDEGGGEHEGEENSL